MMPGSPTKKLIVKDQYYGNREFDWPNSISSKNLPLTRLRSPIGLGMIGPLLFQELTFVGRLFPLFGIWKW